MSTNQNDYVSDSRFASVNGIELYYEVAGEGPALVLLHNFFGTSQNWGQEFKNALAQKYQMVIPDLRGHGRSTNPSNKFTHRQVALDIFALLDELGIDQYRAIGVSSGGMTLLHMATQQPNRIKAMVLIVATSYFPAPCRTIQRDLTTDDFSPEDWEKTRQRHPQGDDQTRALFQQFREMAEIYDDMNFTPPYLATITAPTLIIHGDRDEFFPVNIPVELYQSIPQSYLWIVPNALHGTPMGGYTDNVGGQKSAIFREYFTYTISDFLDNEFAV